VSRIEELNGDWRYQTGAAGKNRLGEDGGCRGDYYSGAWWSAIRQSKRDFSSQRSLGEREVLAALGTRLVTPG